MNLLRANLQGSAAALAIFAAVAVVSSCEETKRSDVHGEPACRSPRGYVVCASERCPEDCVESAGEPAGCSRRPSGVGVCRNAAGAALRTDLCNRAPDGELCISFGAPLELRDGGDVSFAPAPFELGALVAFHGGGAQIRYADLGLWRDASLPEPTDCPELAGAKPCGGACGGCPDGTFCHGRSPLHPTGVCQSTDSRTCAFDIPCRDVEGCFVYRVEPEAQREADTLGVCFPVEQCRALAARLPGGGRCDEASTDAGADGS